MTRYRLRPVEPREIDGLQILIGVTTPNEARDFLPDIPWSHSASGYRNVLLSINVPLAAGTHRDIKDGWWILRDAKDNLTVMSDDEFHKVYEPIPAKVEPEPAPPVAEKAPAEPDVPVIEDGGLMKLLPPTPVKGTPEPPEARADYSRKYITMAEATARMGFSNSTARRLVVKGEYPVPFVREGKWLRVDPLDVEAYLQEKKLNG